MPRSKKPTDHLDAVKHLMGVMADHEIAVLANSTPSIVGRYRRRLGITAYEGYKFGMGQEPPSRKGDEDEVAAVSTPAVSTPAAPVAATAKAVEPAAKAPSRSKLDAYRDVIGKLPDAEVAAMANVTAEGVRIYRRRHEIPLTVTSRAGRKPKAAAAPVSTAASAAERIHKPIVITKELDRAAPAPAAPAPAAPAAVEVPVKRGPGRPRKNPLPETAKTVAPVAKTVAPPTKKKAPKTVAVKAKAAPVASDDKKPLRRASKLDPFGDFIGSLPDKEVAAMAGVTPENVRAFRRRHDIPALWRDENEEAAPAAVVAVAETSKSDNAGIVPAAAVSAPVAPVAFSEPAPEVAPRKEIDKATPVLYKAEPVAAPAAQVSSTKLLNGYALTVNADGQKLEYIIVAANISAAAIAAVKAVAGQHANAEIISIKHLGPALA